MILNVAAQLELPPAWTIHDIFHMGLLTLFRETSQYGDNFPRPPPDIIDGEEEFEVEAIINHRYFRRQHDLQYSKHTKLILPNKGPSNVPLHSTCHPHAQSSPYTEHKMVSFGRTAGICTRGPHWGHMLCHWTEGDGYQP